MIRTLVAIAVVVIALPGCGHHQADWRPIVTSDLVLLESAPMVGAHVWDLGYLGDIRFGEQIAETVYSGKSYVTDNLVMATNSQPPGDCLPSRDTGDVGPDCPGASQWVTETGCIDARRYPGFWEPPGNTVILGRQIATQPSSQYTQVVATLPVPGDCTGFASMAAFLRGALRSTPTVDTARVNKYGAVVDLTINQPNGHVHVEIQATSCDTNCNGGDEVNPLLGIDYEINTDGVSEAVQAAYWSSAGAPDQVAQLRPAYSAKRPRACQEVIGSSGGGCSGVPGTGQDGPPPDWGNDGTPAPGGNPDPPTGQPDPPPSAPTNPVDCPPSACVENIPVQAPSPPSGPVCDPELPICSGPTGQGGGDQGGQGGQGPSQGPTSQGPTSQGPTSQGPTSQGPTSQGPTCDANCNMVKNVICDVVGAKVGDVAVASVNGFIDGLCGVDPPLELICVPVALKLGFDAKLIAGSAAIEGCKRLIDAHLRLVHPCTVSAASALIDCGCHRSVVAVVFCPGWTPFGSATGTSATAQDGSRSRLVAESAHPMRNRGEWARGHRQTTR